MGKAMKKLKVKIILILITFITVRAVNADYEMKSYTINNGPSKIMKGGGYEMQSSLGQVDASYIQIANNYRLNGGFWHQNIDLIFKNDFE